MPFVMKGYGGVVKVGCEWAADLGEWTFTAGGKGGLIEASVTRSNAFYGSRRATELRLTAGRRAWRWRNGSVDAEAGSGVYRVSGPPEE